MLKKFILLPFYFLLINSQTLKWNIINDSDKQIEWTKNCRFLNFSKAKIIEEYHNSGSDEICSKTCFKKEGCTHYFWSGDTCIIKSGYISKQAVNVFNGKSVCGIINSKICKFIKYNLKYILISLSFFEVIF